MHWVDAFFLLFAVSILLSFLNGRIGHPLMAILNRWLRWIAVSGMLTFLLLEFVELDRPLWALATASVLIWGLIETVYNWWLINALSHSDMPLFPRYQTNTDGDEWPINRRAVQLKDWLRTLGFRHCVSAKVPITDALAIRSCIYQDESDQIRCQISFLPGGGSNIILSYVISSRASDGSMIITDNTFMPSGAFYPEKWFVERCPLVRSLPALLKKHKSRLAAFDVETVSFDSHVDPLDELNQQQRELELLNLREGFLEPFEEREDRGRLTFEGRYRLWKEVWLMNYFGRTIR